MIRHSNRQTKGQIERQTRRQTNRPIRKQTNRPIHKHTDRQTSRADTQTYTHPDRQPNTQTYWQTAGKQAGKRQIELYTDKQENKVWHFDIETVINVGHTHKHNDSKGQIADRQTERATCRSSMPLVTSHMHRNEALWKSFTMICWYPPHHTNKEEKKHAQPTHQPHLLYFYTQVSSCAHSGRGATTRYQKSTFPTNP